MKHLSVLVLAVAVGAASACSDDDGSDVVANAGTGGTGGAAAGAGGGGAGGAAGSSGGGAGGGTPVPPPDPALPANAPTVACPAVIDGALEASDPTQTGRHSRIPPISACGATKGYPGNAADPSNPHLFDVYRFENPSNAPVCFQLTLTDGGASVVGDAGLSDASADASTDPGVEGLDAGADAAPPAPAGPERYMAAYGTFYPTNIGLEFLGDVGDDLLAPQTMGITVPAGETVDVVIYGVLNAPLGTGSYTLSCATQ